MNGVHDMGGMQCMGPINHEANEPVFHSVWESRVYAINRALGAWHKWNLDAWRYDIERLPPPDYLRMSYYEKWLAAMENRVVKYGMVTKEELASGKPTPGFSKATPVFTVAMARVLEPRIKAPSNDPSVVPLFQVGERGGARHIKVVLDHGVFLFPDTNSQFLGEKRQHVYSVQFAARELWGEGASPKDSVYLDMWDDYLEHTGS
jgi:hypothetical protein